MSKSTAAKVTDIRKRSYLLAYRSGVDHRTAAAWINNPESCKPVIRARLEAAAKGESTPLESMTEGEGFDVLAAALGLATLQIAQQQREIAVLKAQLLKAEIAVGGKQ